MAQQSPHGAATNSVELFVRMVPLLCEWNVPVGFQHELLFLFSVAADKKIDRWSRQAQELWTYSEEQVLQRLCYEFQFGIDCQKLFEEHTDSEVKIVHGTMHDLHGQPIILLGCELNNETAVFSSPAKNLSENCELLRKTRNLVSNITSSERPIDSRSERIEKPLDEPLASACEVPFVNDDDEFEAISRSISHDLRAPLRAVRGFSALLDRKSRHDLSESGKQHLDTVIEAGRHLEAVMNAIVRYTNIHRRQVHWTRVDLNGLFAQAQESLLELIDNQNCAFSIPESMPFVWGDSYFIKEVLVEILKNSLSYRAPEKQLSINITATLHQHRLILVIADNGVGIPKDQLLRVFDLGQRLHSYDECPGAGYGLAQLRLCMSKLGARFWIDSKPGHGTSIFLEFHGYGVVDS